MLLSTLSFLITESQPLPTGASTRTTLAVRTYLGTLVGPFGLGTKKAVGRV